MGTVDPSNRKKYPSFFLSQIVGTLENKTFLCFYIIERAKIPLNLTSEGLKYPQEVRVQHETCSTINGTPVQAILDQKNLTGLAGGVKEGQNMAQKWASLLYIFGLGAF